MVAHISECVLGVFAFDENKKLLAYKLFPRDVAAIAGRLISIQMEMPTQEHRELIAELIKKRHKKFLLESDGLASKLQDEFKQGKFETLMPNKAGEVLRSSLNEVAAQIGVEEVDKLVHDVNLLLTREKLRKEAAQRDKLIIQAINMLDELDKSINTINGRIREWYSLHFPELNKLVISHETYLKLILSLGTRKNFTFESIKSIGLSDKEASEISHAAENSLGAPFDELDIKAIRNCAQEVLDLTEVREKVAEYIDGLMAQVAPNLRAVIGGSIGARLISLAGGLEDLSKLPASTIQVLGAEKALFRALRTKAKPPKHGVIYQYPDIRGSPKWQRGKIARAIAGKIAIAARVDAMSGEYVGDKLAADLKARIAEIQTRYQKPKKGG
jgi:nucleolar protein 56